MILCLCLILILCDPIHSLRPLMSRRVQKNIAAKNGVTRKNAFNLENIDSEGWTPPTNLDTYEFIPPEVGADIYIGSIVALIPIIWATYEFTNRIRIQQECLVCAGSGLTSVTRSGGSLTKPRKCWSCGGFLPWLGWKMFFLSGLVDPGNGGVLLRPAKDYNETQERLKKEQQEMQQDEVLIAQIETEESV